LQQFALDYKNVSIMDESPENNNNNTNHPSNTETVQNVTDDTEQDFFDDLDNNTWTATGEMRNLPTGIFKRNLLSNTVRKSILQAEPRNRDISFEPPIMDRKLWSAMSKNNKEQDKNLRRATYRFSSVVRPIDNTLRLVYASKPDDESGSQYEAWLQLEQTVLNTRALALDALSFTNELRQEQALKATISPIYHKPPGKEEVFGDELNDIIKTENESNKILNDAAMQRKRASQSFTSRNQQSYNVNYRLPHRPFGYRGRGYRGNRGNSWRGTSHKSENSNQGGQSTRQS
jgi:hypothetical protein